MVRKVGHGNQQGGCKSKGKVKRLRVSGNFAIKKKSKVQFVTIVKTAGILVALGKRGIEDGTDSVLMGHFQLER